MERDCNQGYVNAIINNKQADLAKNKLETNIGTDTAEKLIKNNITAIILDNWFKSELDFSPPKLNDAELKRIKKGIIEIVSPVFKDNERAELENNVDKIIRKCANITNKEMSWSQRWKQLGENALERLYSLIKLETQVQKIIKNNPTIVNSIKKSFNTTSTAQIQKNQTTIPNNKSDLLSR